VPVPAAIGRLHVAAERRRLSGNDAPLSRCGILVDVCSKLTGRASDSQKSVRERLLGLSVPAVGTAALRARVGALLPQGTAILPVEPRPADEFADPFPLGAGRHLVVAGLGQQCVLVRLSPEGRAGLPRGRASATLGLGPNERPETRDHSPWASRPDIMDTSSTAQTPSAPACSRPPDSRPEPLLRLARHPRPPRRLSRQTVAKDQRLGRPALRAHKYAETCNSPHSG
jgi:hypothetical protein